MEEIEQIRRAYYCGNRVSGRLLESNTITDAWCERRSRERVRRHGGIDGSVPDRDPSLVR